MRFLSIIKASKICEIYDNSLNDNCFVYHDKCTESNNEICTESDNDRCTKLNNQICNISNKYVCTDDVIKCREVLKCWEQIAINTSLHDCCEGSYILDYEPGKEDSFTISKNNEETIFECHNEMNLGKFRNHLHIYNRLCGRNTLIRRIYNAEGNREELFCHDDEVNNISDTKYVFNDLKLKTNIKKEEDFTLNVSVNTQKEKHVAFNDNSAAYNKYQSTNATNLYTNELVNEETVNNDPAIINKEYLSDIDNINIYEEESAQFVRDPIYLEDELKVDSFAKINRRRLISRSIDYSDEFYASRFDVTDFEPEHITGNFEDDLNSLRETIVNEKIIEGSSVSQMNYLAIGAGIGVLIGLIMYIISKFCKKRITNRRNQETIQYR